MKKFMDKFHYMISYSRPRRENEAYDSYFPAEFTQNSIYGPLERTFDTKNQSQPMLITVSNCIPWRMTMIAKFLDYFTSRKIASYGGCMHNQIHHIPSVVSGNNVSESDHNRIRSFKFFFAIENSLCRDYMTEKILNSYILDAIPIVASKIIFLIIHGCLNTLTLTYSTFQLLKQQRNTLKMYQILKNFGIPT
eukprot:UN34823